MVGNQELHGELSQQLILPAGAIVSTSVFFRAFNIRQDLEPGSYAQVTLSVGGTVCQTAVVTDDTDPIAGITISCTGIVIFTDNPTVKVDIHLSAGSTPGGLSLEVDVDNIVVSPTFLPCPGAAPPVPPLCAPPTLSPATTNLVSNPGFENLGSISPWTSSGAGISILAANNAPGGDPGIESFAVVFAELGTLTLQQQISLSAGSQVLPSFWFETGGIDPDYEIDIAVSFGSQVWATARVRDFSNPWIEIGPDTLNPFMVTEANPILSIAITASGDPSIQNSPVTVFIDNVSVTPSCLTS